MFYGAQLPVIEMTKCYEAKAVTLAQKRCTEMALLRQTHVNQPKYSVTSASLVNVNMGLMVLG
ncbi:hypothetical protein [Paraglaciecola sp. MB-3u-78]|uniref:hypothetical protein n=1 Tax=Paraglaciecola sp. MB-3u-78 TaxID=2058332 RepID=UPI000C31F7CE|nr:hypothetical protein [Paraglaciecola sp. MB-3u-78]PKG98526.1 hypothetical protein CXF95_11590 [Paraglaciecola sp. MB-3u-78]